MAETLEDGWHPEELDEWFDRHVDTFWTLIETEIGSLLSMGLELKDLSTSTTVGGNAIEILFKGRPIRRFTMTFIDDGK